MAFPTSGKYYWELTLNNTPLVYLAGIYSANRPLTGETSATGNEYQVAWGTAYSYIRYQSNNSATANWGTNTNPTSGDVLMFAFDADNSTMWIGRNGTWYNTSGTANPATNTDPRFSSIPSGMFAGVNLANPASGGVSLNFGQRPFAYTPPSGFKALNTFNLPTPTVINAAQYMAATIWTGNGTSQTISNAVNGISFQPDFIWIKSRGSAYNHFLSDVNRGITTNYLFSDLTSAEASASTVVTAVSSTGFSVGSALEANQSATGIVGWQWKANGAGSTNTAGTITSTVSANTSAGFSIVTFTAPSSNQSFTVGHGLGVAPSMVIKKRRDSSVGGSWWTWHIGLGDNTTDYLALNTTDAESSLSNMWGTVGRTSTLLGFNVTASCVASETAVVYCFAQVAGYSAFGSYTGNGSSNGTFVYTGFEPKFILWKRTNAVEQWTIWTPLADGNGIASSNNFYLLPNSSAAQDTTQIVDTLSNGFKHRDSGSLGNANGGNYIYMAFAESPFKYANAR